jgi:hypothetical protein
MLKTTLSTLAIYLLACYGVQTAQAQTPQSKIATTNAVAAPPNIAGDWHGTLSTASGQFRVVLKVV